MTDLQEILSGGPPPSAENESASAGEQTGSASPAPAAPNWTHSETPAGFTISYCPDPREYRIDDVVVPSVTTVLDCLSKPALTWWGMKIGVESSQALIASGKVPEDFLFYTTDEWIKLLTEHKLTVNHQRDKAAIRGTSVHNALEAFCVTGELPEEADFPTEEQGYVRGVRAFIADCKGHLEPLESELMVGSKEHGFAGRFDMQARIRLSEGIELKTGPRTTRTLPVGTGIFDLKTSKGIYDSHFLQLSAYRLGLEESGYGRSDFECVIQVSSEGRYDVKLNPRRPDQFLAVLNTWKALR